MLMKSIPGVNFINVFRTAFMPVAPQSVRTQSSRQYLFMLSGPTSVKVVRKMLMKSTPDRDSVASDRSSVCQVMFSCEPIITVSLELFSVSNP